MFSGSSIVGPQIDTTQAPFVLSTYLIGRFTRFEDFNPTDIFGDANLSSLSAGSCGLLPAASSNFESINMQVAGVSAERAAAMFLAGRPSRGIRLPAASARHIGDFQHLNFHQAKPSSPARLYPVKVRMSTKLPKRLECDDRVWRLSQMLLDINFVEARLAGIVHVRRVCCKETRFSRESQQQMPEVTIGPTTSTIDNHFQADHLRGYLPIS